METLKYSIFGLAWLLACLFIVYIIRSRKSQSNFRKGLTLIMISFVLGITLLMLLLLKYN